MADFVSGCMSTALLCSLGVLLMKICSLRGEFEEAQPEYVLMTAEQYEFIKNKPDVKIILDQPQMPPKYSKTDDKSPLIPI
jgi:hypothetical protein